MSDSSAPQGKIFLVGLGPGSEEHMTARARQAIAESDTIIGYSTYIKLITDIAEGKEIIRKGMTEELDRCHEALARAREGKKVSLISSGDVGVYGMAGPTYEVLFESGWRPGDGVEVEVVPGTSAINSCASLVGAPLTHDACTISLSDLLTPWPTIRKRLVAAASADFVTALYNPKSGRRTQQIVQAQEIFLQYRAPSTPVALIKSAYRRRQHIELTTLDKMAEADIGMLTTVIVGNSKTFIRDGIMVTPRGYANKYTSSLNRHDVIEGEKGGRSLSMGLLGWQACARDWLAADSTRNLRDAVKFFDVPFAQILQAVRSDYWQSTDSWNAVLLDNTCAETVAIASQWPEGVRAVVRQGAGAIAELIFAKLSTSSKGDWINVITEHAHLHVNSAEITHCWALARGEAWQALHFTNLAGDLVLSLLPMAKQLPLTVSAESLRVQACVIDVEEDDEVSADE